jgi:hypothetical protein
LAWTKYTILTLAAFTPLLFGAWPANAETITCTEQVIGTATKNDPIDALVFPSVQEAQFFDNPTGTAPMGPRNLGFASYDLKTAIGPLSGTQWWAAPFNINTTSGLFELRTLSGDVSFAAAVPEPSTMLLPGSGLAGFVGFRRKFRK